jgi:hypothetical protein
LTFDHYEAALAKLARPANLVRLLNLIRNITEAQQPLKPQKSKHQFGILNVFENLRFLTSFNFKKSKNLIMISIANLVQEWGTFPGLHSVRLSKSPKDFRKIL